jgi:TP901 family phage tail tape measure protein
MADSTLRLSIDARPARQGAQEFKRSAESIRKQAGGVAGAVERANGSLNRLVRGAFSLQSALAGIGAGVAIGDTLRRFGRFQEQLVQVGKTADLEGRRLDQLGQRIQDIAQDVPIATTRLLSLASAAGQLGVQGVDNIAKFTEVLGKLETATDIQGEQGARDLARLLNITGEDVSNIDRLGSALTALGNNFATTEQEITQTSTFLASSTQQFGVTAQEVIGLSGALRALGQRAETSGSSVGAALTEINTAINEGGESLQSLVDLTGKSTDELRRQFGESATGVLLDFAEALGSIPAAQQTEVLDQFNLAGRETRRVIGALASNTELARDALRTANTEWDRNQALNREAARAAETFSAQIQLTANAFDEAAVIAGRELAPVVLDLANNFRDFLQQASDNGQIKEFFQGAANASEAFLDNLKNIARGVLALKGALSGAALGSRLGGGVGALLGGAGGAAAGAAAPDVFTALIRQAAEAGDAVEDFGAKSASANEKVRRLAEQGVESLKTQLNTIKDTVLPALEVSASLSDAQNLLISQGFSESNVKAFLSGFQSIEGAIKSSRQEAELLGRALDRALRFGTGDGDAPAPRSGNNGDGLPTFQADDLPAALRPQNVVGRENDIRRQRDKLREQAERLRADLNPALAEYQERVQNIQNSSPFLTQAEQAELLKQAYADLADQQDRFGQEIRFAEQIADRSFDRIGSAITQAFAQGEDAAISFRSIGRSVISELTQAFVQLAAINPLKNALLGQDNATLSTAIQGIGSLFGPLAFSGFSASPTLSASPGGSSVSGLNLGSGGFSAGVGFRESGGPVSAGKPYVVGEKRPELFVPSQNGTIIPSVPNGGTTINITQNISANGDKQVAQIARQAAAQGIQEAAPAIVSQSVQQTGERMRRNPKFGRRG